MDLQINARKTELLQRHLNNSSPVDFTVRGKPLWNVEHFTYLGSIVSEYVNIDDNVNKRIQLAFLAFGHLRSSVLK